MKRMIFFLFVTTTIFQSLLLLPDKVYGWGQDGHIIVANIAYRKLSNATKTKINNILMNDDEKPDENMTILGLISNWADVVRHTKEYFWSTPLHYIDIEDEMIVGGCPCSNCKDDTFASNLKSNNHNNTVSFIYSKTMNDIKQQRRLIRTDQHQAKVTMTTKISSSCHFVYNRDCKDNFCAAGAIMNYTDILKAGSSNISSLYHRSSSSSSSSNSRIGRLLRGSQNNNGNDSEESIKNSLKFLTHYIGDIHQPLHVSRKTDIGGNKFHVFFNDNTKTSHRKHQNNNTSHELNYNLHSVWDVGIIKRTIHENYNDSRYSFEHYIEESQKQQQDYDDNGCSSTFTNNDGTIDNDKIRKCIILWSKESLYYALHYAYKNTGASPPANSSIHDGVEVANGTILNDLYYHTSLPIVIKRLSVASLRLAYILEYIFS